MEPRKLLDIINVAEKLNDTLEKSKNKVLLFTANGG